MKKKIIVILAFVCGVGGYFIFGGTDTPKPTPTYAPLATPDANGQLDPWAPYMPPTTLTPNENGIYEVNIPVNLLDGMTADEFIDNTLAHPLHSTLFTDIMLNLDGEGVLILYTDELLETSRHFYYNYILMFADDDFSASIKRIIFENELVSGIVVYVDVEEYGDEQSITPEIVHRDFPIGAGLFQLLSGVAPEDWHVTITVRCYDTGELVSREEFPSDDMFEREW